MFGGGCVYDFSIPITTELNFAMRLDYTRHIEYYSPQWYAIILDEGWLSLSLPMPYNNKDVVKNRVFWNDWMVNRLKYTNKNNAKWKETKNCKSDKTWSCVKSRIAFFFSFSSVITISAVQICHGCKMSHFMNITKYLHGFHNIEWVFVHIYAYQQTFVFYLCNRLRVHGMSEHVHTRGLSIFKQQNRRWKQKNHTKIKRVFINRADIYGIFIHTCPLPISCQKSDAYTLEHPLVFSCNWNSTYILFLLFYCRWWGLIYRFPERRWKCSCSFEHRKLRPAHCWEIGRRKGMWDQTFSHSVVS